MLDAKDFELHVSGDRMQASLTLSKREELRVSVAELHEALHSRGVTFGIDPQALAAIEKSPQAGTPYLVARGVAPKDGVSEKVEYKFATDGTIKPEETESGTVDFRNIKNFSNFREGDLLAVKTPASTGASGTNVMGEEIKARDGRTVALRVGKGARLTEDGMAAIADCSGHACLVGDRVSVLSTIEVPTNVNYAVGNIKFIGSVKIRGGVMPGFSVEAEGDIEINDNVEKANLRCSGNLEIRGIVFGQGDCHIEVGGSAKINAVDQAELLVRGNLTVNSYIRHSKVLVGGSVEVIGKKGSIIGGDVRAFRGIQMPFVGNSMATLTKLTVGLNPFVSQEVNELRAQMEEVETKLTQVKTALHTLATRAAASGQLDAQSQALAERLKLARTQLEPQLATLGAKLTESQDLAADYKEARIRVAEIAYPGVVINFRDRMQYKTMDELQHCSFYEEAAEIRNGPY